MVLGFFRNEQNSESSDEMVLDTLNELELCSKVVQFELMKGTMKWNEDKVQAFIPLILNLTDFDWLELIAKHECKQDYEVIKKYLDHVQALIKNGNEILFREGVTDGRI